MKKSNVILQAAVAGALLAMFGSANAATAVSTTSVKYAAEQFAGTTPYAAVVAPTVSVISATAIPAGSIITVVVELTGGVFAVTQAGDTTANTAANKVDATTAMPLAAPTCTMGSTTAGVTVAAAGVVAPTTTASNANVVSCQFTTVNAVGIGGTVIRIATPHINAAGLASTANTVTATGTILVGTVAAPVGAAVATTGTLEAASAPTTVATSAQGITLAAAAGTAGQIDLTATPVASAFTGAVSATVVDLGTVTATDGTAKLVTAGNAAYNIAAKATKTMTTTIAAPAGFFGALKTTGTIHLETVSCGGGVVLATSSVFSTAAAAAAAASVSTPATQPVTATAYHVCMTIPASGSTSVALIEGTPTVSAVLGAAAAQDSAETLAATNLWPLAYNGTTKTVRNYVPSTVVGYPMTVRVANTGSVAAAITVTMKGESGATIGVPYTTASLAAGATTRILQAAIETGVGVVPAATERPRLIITAPTNGLDVQTFINTPGSGYTNLSGTE